MDDLKYFVISYDSSGNSKTLNYLYKHINPKNLIIVTTLDKGCEYHSHYTEAWVLIVDTQKNSGERLESILKFAKNNKYESIIILYDDSILNLDIDKITNTDKKEEQE